MKLKILLNKLIFYKCDMDMKKLELLIKFGLNITIEMIRNLLSIGIVLPNLERFEISGDVEQFIV